jgi:hypothetical protein
VAGVDGKQRQRKYLSGMDKLTAKVVGSIAFLVRSKDHVDK